MHHTRIRNFLLLVVFFSLAAIALRWSWNTLAGLFDLPAAQFEHAVAALLLLALLKVPLHRRSRSYPSIPRRSP